MFDLKFQFVATSIKARWYLRSSTQRTTMSVFHSIGTQEFLPALLTHIRNSATSIIVPLDLVILQSILLCLIAGEKNLILRTPDEDVALTVQLAVWVSAKRPKLHFYLCSRGCS